MAAAATGARCRARPHSNVRIAGVDESVGFDWVMATTQSPINRPARLVNSEAGDHLVTSDPAEVAAADRAVKRSWAEFPYYARRYDERGRRFSASDSGWLVTLCDLGTGPAVAQATWLASVLAARGMPRWLLECHLGYLHEELVAAMPERAARYAPLLAAAEALRARRTNYIPHEVMTALGGSFDREVGEELARKHRRMGTMLVAAVADERDGLAQAVPSLMEWAADPERFSPAWVQAVQGTVAAARAWRA